MGAKKILTNNLIIYILVFNFVMTPKKLAEELVRKLPNILTSLIMIFGVVIVSSFFNIFSPQVADINTTEGYVKTIIVSGLLITVLVFMLRFAVDLGEIIELTLELIEFKLPGIKKEDSMIKRILKKITYIVFLILAVAFFSPLISQIPEIGGILTQIFVFISLVVSLVFIYDVAKTYEGITRKNTKLIVDMIMSLLSKIKRVKK